MMIRLTVVCAWIVAVLILALGPTVAGTVLATTAFGVVVWGCVEYVKADR